MIVSFKILLYKKHYSNLKMKQVEKMYTMAFDTTGNGCSIALLKDGKVLDVYEKRSEFGQAEFLIPQMKEILAKNEVSFSDIETLFVCVGPGSFTGVRSGIAAAKVFQLASRKLVTAGVSAFEAYAESFEEKELSEINAVIIETKRDDFYVQLFDKNRKELIEPEVMVYEDLLKILKNKGVTISVCGDGVERFLSQPSGLSLHAVKLNDMVPIKCLALAGLKKLKDKKINYPKPLYLRAPEVSMPKNKN